MVKKFLFTTFSLLSILMLLVMGAGTPLSAAAAPLVQDGDPTIVSDQADYPPGATVTLTGMNWQGDTDVRIVVNDDVGQTWSRDVIVPVAGDGTIFDSFNLPNYFVATYRVVASGQQTGSAVTYTFTDANPAADIDQCANGDLVPGSPDQGSGRTAQTQRNGAQGAQKGPSTASNQAARIARKMG